MDIDWIANELLGSPSPSIRYRIQKEALGLNPNLSAMRKLEEEILLDPLVLKTLELFGPAGFQGSRFHTAGLKEGEEALEVSLRLLFEKGVEPDHPKLKKALDDLEAASPDFDREFHHVGGILDKFGLGGSSLIRAYLLARGGRGESKFVQGEIAKVIRTLEYVAGVETLKDVAEDYRGKLVFRPGALWPGIYHFRLLAFTKSWRNAKNFWTVVKALRNLTRLSPIPSIYLKFKSRLVAPATVYALDFSGNLHEFKEQEWAFWFERCELLGRMGILMEVPLLQKQVEALRGIVSSGAEQFRRFRKHRAWTNWSSYMGLALESDWSSKEARVRDALFRSLLILHFSGAFDRAQV